MHQHSFISNFKIITKIIVFLTIFLLIFHFLGDILYKKSNIEKTWDCIYSERKQDVIFFGNSHVFTTFNTQYMSAIGINSINVANSAETFYNTYYNVKEVLRYQTPDLIVIELNSLLYTDNREYKDIKGLVLTRQLGMKYRFNRINIIKKTIDKSDYITALFPQVIYHENWKRYKNIQQNFKANKEKDITKGYEALSEVISEDLWNKTQLYNINRLELLQNYNGDLLSISDEYISMLKDIVSLCDGKEIDLIFVKSPVAGERFLAASKTIEYLEKKYDIKVFDFNKIFNELNLVRKDYSDTGHLNFRGSLKVTNYFLKNFMLKKYNYDIDYSKLEESMVLKGQEAKKIKDDIYRFTINFYNPNLLYAFYLYKDNSRIDTKYYTKENYYDLITQDKGEYKVLYFAIESSVETIKTYSGVNKKSDWFYEKVIIK